MSNLHPIFAKALKPFAPQPESDGLCLLIIPQDDALSDVLATDTAIRLIARGASLYCLRGGSCVLAITKPAGAFAKAVSLNVFFQEAV